MLCCHSNPLLVLFCSLLISSFKMSVPSPCLSQRRSHPSPRWHSFAAPEVIHFQHQTSIPVQPYSVNGAQRQIPADAPAGMEALGALHAENISYSSSGFFFLVYSYVGFSLHRLLGSYCVSTPRNSQGQSCCCEQTSAERDCLSRSIPFLFLRFCIHVGNLWSVLGQVIGSGKIKVLPLWMASRGSFRFDGQVPIIRDRPVRRGQPHPPKAEQELVGQLGVSMTLVDPSHQVFSIVSGLSLLFWG